ncbi:hypothetical protein [Dysgonomonas sp. ZJ709]|uniref:hypothetical protein n=1 Tax=Dysgonomonas sp. ZJ709 TaxID=2709797 RepID=UPI0013E9DC34|nr:hypothetical protein [Dysgonomonas sp. ZJ709]
MAKIFEDGHVVITYETSLKDIYWVELSNYLREKYTDDDFADKNQTESILKDAFQYLVDLFRNKIHHEVHFSFYSHIFKLHEESIKLLLKAQVGYVLSQIEENEFSIYRRILKLVLEEGCAIDLDWGMITNEEALRIENVLEHLIYLGTMMYELSENLSYNKMIKDCYTIDIKEGLFGVTLNHHFGWTYESIKTRIMPGQYEAAICDENAAQELVDKIQEVYGFHVGNFIAHIRDIQRTHNPTNPNSQTIEPYILPLNLSTLLNKPEDLMQSFCNGLTINRNNKPSIETAIYKPTDENRYAYRPILVYNIEGVDRALIGTNKIDETFQMLTTNALHWKGLPNEWLENQDVKDFMNRKDLEHESIYINKIKELIENVECLVDYNVENLLRKNNQNISIIKNPGEIDCIIIIPALRRIIVSDIKFNRARYEAVGWQKDFTNFIKTYESKLQKKADWIRNHISELQEHFKVKFVTDDLSFEDYSVECCFFINAPTFYMFNGKYRAITIKELPDFFNGWLGHVIINPDNPAERIGHPYFLPPAQEPV